MQWDEMTAMERDALIAEIVFGRKVYREKTWNQWLLHHETKPGLTEPIPHYSQSLDDAWLIVRHFASLPDEPFEQRYQKQFFMRDMDVLPCNNPVFYDISLSMLALWTPGKICRAALKALIWKDDKRE